MKKKALFAGVAAATLLVGGWALAQTYGPGHGPRTDQPMGPGAMHRMGPGPGHQMGPGMGHQMGPGMMQQRMQQMHRGPGDRGPGYAFVNPTQLDTLKRDIGITAAQEQAWTKYAKTVADASTAMAAAREGVDPEAVRNLSPADRFAFVSKIREQAQKQHEAVKTAADELLAVLDDAQKAKARDVLPGIADVGPGPTRGAEAQPPQQQHRH